MLLKNNFKCQDLVRCFRCFACAVCITHRNPPVNPYVSGCLASALPVSGKGGFFYAFYLTYKFSINKIIDNKNQSLRTISILTFENHASSPLNKPFYLT